MFEYIDILLIYIYIHLYIHCTPVYPLYSLLVEPNLAFVCTVYPTIGIPRLEVIHTKSQDKPYGMGKCQFLYRYHIVINIDLPPSFIFHPRKPWKWWLHSPWMKFHLVIMPVHELFKWWQWHCPILHIDIFPGSTASQTK